MIFKLGGSKFKCSGNYLTCLTGSAPLDINTGQFELTSSWTRKKEEWFPWKVKWNRIYDLRSFIIQLKAWTEVQGPLFYYFWTSGHVLARAFCNSERASPNLLIRDTPDRFWHCLTLVEFSEIYQRNGNLKIIKIPNQIRSKTMTKAGENL